MKRIIQDTSFEGYHGIEIFLVKIVNYFLDPDTESKSLSAITPRDLMSIFSG